MAETWKFVRTGCKVIDGRGRKIADVSVAYCGEDEIMARGNAIAAAPQLQALNTELVAALKALQEAEAGYRIRHDRFGDGSISAGKAWDNMRHAGDKARTTLKKAQSQ